MKPNPLPAASIPRRSALLALGLGAAAASRALSGCTSAPTRSAPTITGDRLPTTIPNDSIPYDLEPSADGIVPGFLLSYPADPQASVQGTPGGGGELVAACQINTPAPVPMENNAVWQQLNQQLGATLRIHYTPGDEWEAKQQSLLAGGELPDFLSLGTQVPRMPEVLTKRCADLSEFLSGDKIADYPNLAMIGQTAWLGVAFDNGIYGIPQSVPRYGGTPLRTRQDILDRLGIGTVTARDGNDLIALMREVIDPKANRWASAVPSVDQFAQMMGAPNGWSDTDGRLTHGYTTEEYAAAIDQVARLWQDGVFHPDSFSTGAFPANFDKGNTVIEFGLFDPGTRLQVGGAGNPDYRVGFIVLPKFDGGGVAEAWTATGVRGFTVLRPDTPEKLQEKLRVLNWIAAPTGTKEGTLTRYGIEGRNYTIRDGAVVAIPEHQSEVLILGYIAGAPVTFTASTQTMADVYTDFSARLTEQYAKPKDDPTAGHYSATQSAEGISWTKRLEDTRAQIVQGRKPLTAWQETITEWQRTVGDSIGTEYEDALSR